MQHSSAHHASSVPVGSLAAYPHCILMKGCIVQIAFVHPLVARALLHDAPHTLRQHLPCCRRASSGQLSGIGVEVGLRSAEGSAASRAEVLSVVPGGPADRAGVAAGDTLLSIDAKDVGGLSLYSIGQWSQRREWLSLATRGGGGAASLTMGLVHAHRKGIHLSLGTAHVASTQAPCSRARPAAASKWRSRRRGAGACSACSGRDSWSPPSSTRPAAGPRTPRTFASLPSISRLGSRWARLDQGPTGPSSGISGECRVPTPSPLSIYVDASSPTSPAASLPV